VKKRTLGRSGFEVSVLCLGTMQFGWTAEEPASHAVLDAFVEAGGNFVDTADMYSSWAPGNPGGVSEEIIGRWLAERRSLRKELVVATKLRARMWPGPDGEGLSPKRVEKACDDSLRRLKIDEIDLYQCHWPDEAVPFPDTLHALSELVRKGKVRALGLSNYSAAQTQDALSAAKDLGLERVTSQQPKHSLVVRDVLEGALLELCKRESIGVMPYSPLAGGFLTGKYRPHEPLPPTPRAANASKHLGERGVRVLEALDRIAKARGATVPSVALAWQLGIEGVTASIIGANTVLQLRELLPAASLELEPSERGLLDTASSG